MCLSIGPVSLHTDQRGATTASGRAASCRGSGAFVRIKESTFRSEARTQHLTTRFAAHRHPGGTRNRRDHNTGIVAGRGIPNQIVPRVVRERATTRRGSFATRHHHRSPIRTPHWIDKVRFGATQSRRRATGGSNGPQVSAIPVVKGDERYRFPIGAPGWRILERRECRRRDTTWRTSRPLLHVDVPQRLKSDE